MTKWGARDAREFHEKVAMPAVARKNRPSRENLFLYDNVFDAPRSIRTKDLVRAPEHYCILNASEYTRPAGRWWEVDQSTATSYLEKYLLLHDH